MKKFAIFIILLIAIFTLTACKDSISENNHRRPFENFEKDDIKEVKLFVVLPEVEIALSKEQIPQLVDTLNKIVVNKKALFFKENEIVGQLVRIQIVKSDGSVLTIKELNPYLILTMFGMMPNMSPVKNLINLPTR